MFQSKNSDFEDTDAKEHLKEDKKEGQLIDCMRTSLQIDLSIGSTDSKLLLDSATRANEKVFRTNITYVIDYKYQQICERIIIYRLVHSLFFGMNIAYAYS